jgi:secreted repeat protein with Y-X4-D motif
LRPSPGLAAASAPSAVVDPAVQTANGFSLRGTIEPHELDTHYHFEYGTTTSYGTNVPMPEADAGSGGLYYPTVYVSQPVTGLAPSATYHYRLVATNSDGSATSGDETFATPAASEVPSPPPGQYPNEPGSAYTGNKVVAKKAKVRGKTLLTTTSGHTLYSFTGDKRPGQAKGEGLKDAGTWHLAPGTGTR